MTRKGKYVVNHTNYLDIGSGYQQTDQGNCRTIYRLTRHVMPVIAMIIIMGWLTLEVGNFIEKSRLTSASRVVLLD